MFIATRIREYAARREEQRIEQLCAELRKKVHFARAHIEKQKQSGQPHYWVQLNVPDVVREYHSPGFPFLHWSPTFRLRVQQAFEPILHDFFNMLVQEPMRYRMEQTGFMKTPPRWALSRLLPRNRYGDSPLWRYYLTINARSL